MTTTTVGSKSGVWSFGNNDADESPFQLTLSGEVTANTQPPVENVDLIQDGAVLIGSWYNQTTTAGYEGDLSRINAGDGSATATFTFDNLTPGVYKVSGWWVGWSKNASNTPFTISDGTNEITVTVNQKVRSGGAEALGLGSAGG